MTITTIIMSAIALLLSAAALFYCVKLTLVYHRFNEQVKDWSRSLDESARFAIDMAARRILREIDDNITQQNQNKDNGENQPDAEEPRPEDE